MGKGKRESKWSEKNGVGVVQRGGVLKGHIYTFFFWGGDAEEDWGGRRRADEQRRVRVDTRDGKG